MRVYELENRHLLLWTEDRKFLSDGDCYWEAERFNFDTMMVDIEDDPNDLWTFRELSVREKVNEIDGIISRRNCINEYYNSKQSA